MHSQARLTYNQVWAAVGEKDEEARAQMGAVLPHVERLHQLYQVLAKARASAARSSSTPAKCASCSTPAAKWCRAACWSATTRTS
jgi:exoribonuclease R